MKKLFACVCLVVFALASAFGEATLNEAPKKLAIFVKNDCNVEGMDDMVDGVRNRLAVALAAFENFEVMDSAQIADTFRKYKVTVNDEKQGVYFGIFTGGSVPNIASMLGCDYIITASIVDAGSLRRNVGGVMTTTFNLRMAVKVMDVRGNSVYGITVHPYTMPVANVADDPMNYYNILFDRWATEAASDIAKRSPSWRKLKPANVEIVSFEIKTTIDEIVSELESQTRGAKGEKLAELRKVVGGVTIELDGAVIGSSPNAFQTTKGLHQLCVKREWMKPYTATVNIRDGMLIMVALEMSKDGLSQWGSQEGLRAQLAKDYARAAMERGVKVNLDSAKWRDVGAGNNSLKITE